MDLATPAATIGVSRTPTKVLSRAADPRPAAPWLLSARVANVALLVLGGCMFFLLAVGAHNQDQRRIITFTATALALAIPYFAAAWVIWRARPARSTLVLGLTFAAAFRLFVVFSPATPYLSTDLYRYIWDGRVQAAGINPYRYVPADEALSKLRDPEIYEHINRRDYARTIYPPVAEAIFFLTTRLSENVLWMKATMVLFECVAMWALLHLLRSHGLPPQRALLYAWHPLPLWEFAGSGHVDAFMIAFILLALVARRAGRDGLVGLALAAATLTKLFPVILFPALWRRWRWRMPVVFAAAIVLAYVPYYCTVGAPPKSGVVPDFLPGADPDTIVARPVESPALWKAKVLLGFLPSYTHEEGIESGDRFYLLSLLPVRPLFGLDHPRGREVFIVLAALALGGAAAWAFLRREENDGLSPLRRTAAMGAIFITLLSPGYAWYFCWLVPFLTFAPSFALLWMTAVPSVLYMNWFHSQAHEVFLLNSTIYLPAAWVGLSACAIRWRRQQIAARDLAAVLPLRAVR